MRITAKYWLLILLMGNVFLSNAQTVLKGFVTDSLGKSIPMINVFVKPHNSQRIIAYSYSNKKGEYEIEIKSHGKFTLNGSGMGYSSIQLNITIDSIATPKTIINDIILQEKPFTLDEVILNADRPIVIKKDTISIKASAFTNGSEEVVEDILKKLPGIEVMKDGTVKVQGKSVEKIMIEGDDLFEKGYKLLTKNLHAGVIDKVEILEHFSDNALLKNIEDSEKVAINLTLKEGQKSTLFGNISLGYGTNQFYENKLNLISFNKKSKYYFFGNANNSGSDAIGDIYQIIYPDIFTAETYIGDGISGDNFINITNNKPNINESRFKFNNAELTSLNTIHNPSNKLKVKALVFFASDEIDLKSSSFEEFTLPPISFSNTENNFQKKKSVAISGKLDFIYRLSEDAQIEYVGRYNNGNFKDKALLVFNDEAITERLNSKSIFTNHRITYTNRISKTQALQLTARNVYDDKPQSYEVDSFLFDTLFPNAVNSEVSRQENRNIMRFLGVEGTYIVNNGRSIATFKTGFTNSKNRLKTNLSFDGLNQNPNGLNNLFSNDFSASLNDLYLKANYKYTFKKFSLRASANLHKFISILNSQTIEDKKAPTTLIPSIGFSWNINKKNKLITSYKYNTRNLSFNQIFNGYTLTNYRNFKRGTGTFSQLKGSFFLASYMLGNWSDSFLVNTSLIYNKNHDYLGGNSQVEPNYVLSNPILLKNREFYSFNFTGDKLLEVIATNVKLKASISKSTFQNTINNSELRTIESNSYTYGGEFRSVLVGRFNFHLGTKWTTSLIKSSLESKNTINTSFLDLIFDLSPNFSVQVANESYYFESLPSNKTSLFTDFNLRYKAKESRFSFKFLINNLFNYTTFSNFNISDSGSYGSNFRLLPRYFLLKMDYRF